jgi:hypothetical protein
LHPHLALALVLACTRVRVRVPLLALAPPPSSLCLPLCSLRLLSPLVTYATHYRDSCTLLYNYYCLC